MEVLTTLGEQVGCALALARMASSDVESINHAELVLARRSGAAAVVTRGEFMSAFVSLRPGCAGAGRIRIGISNTTTSRSTAPLPLTLWRFRRRQRGIVCGFITDRRDNARPVVLLTSDGGAHWAETTVKEAGISLFFLDDSIGWMVTEKGIWQTVESGRSWTKLPKAPAGTAARLVSR